MTHEDAGHYAAKHAANTTVDARITPLLNEKLKDGAISCAVAHAIASKLNVSPADVGIAADLAEAMIVKCQMGLFGYSPKKCIVEPADDVSSELAEAIRSGMVNERLPCRTAWDIAKQNGLSKMEISSACEALGIKIKPCQIGAF